MRQTGFIFSIVLAAVLCAAQAFAQGNPPDRILRGAGATLVNADGSITLKPAPSRSVKMPCSATQPPVSAAGTASWYVDCLSNAVLVSINGSAYVSWAQPTGGSVTSVGLMMPSPLFGVTGSPVTSAGGFTVTLNNQAAGSFFAGPPAGTGPGTPAFRAIGVDDIPALDVGKITTGVFGQTRGGTGINSYTYGDLLYAGAGAVLTRLPGNTLAQKRFLTETGDGTFAGVPTYSPIIAADLPIIDLATTAPGGVTGTLPVNRGGTGLTALGGVNRLLGANSGNTGFEFKQVLGGSGISITQGAGSIQIEAVGGGIVGTKWNNAASPDGDLNLSMSAYRTAFVWNNATGSNDLFSLSDGASNTGTGSVLKVATAAGSLATPFKVTAGGNLNGVTMDLAGALLPIGAGSVYATHDAASGQTLDNRFLNATGDTASGPITVNRNGGTTAPVGTFAFFGSNSANTSGGVGYGVVGHGYDGNNAVLDVRGVQGIGTGAGNNQVAYGGYFTANANTSGVAVGTTAIGVYGTVTGACATCLAGKFDGNTVTNGNTTLNGALITTGAISTGDAATTRNNLGFHPYDVSMVYPAITSGSTLQIAGAAAGVPVGATILFAGYNGTPVTGLTPVPIGVATAANTIFLSFVNNTGSTVAAGSATMRFVAIY